MINPIPMLLWKVIAVVLLLGALSASFYSVGLDKGREELALYKLTVKAIGDAQEAKTKQVIISQQQIANEANDEATKLRAALTNYFNDPRVHVDYGTSVRKLPSVPNATKRVDASAAESPLDTSGVEANITVGSKAANDALTILLLQKWIEENVALRP